MAGARPRKPASDRRKQQNRQAQKGYRERQKQRLQALERLVKEQDHQVVASNVNNGSTSLAISPENEEASQATSTSSSLCVTSSSSRTEDETPELSARKRVLNKFMQQIDSVDEAVYSQIVSGEIPISEIFRAGLRDVLAQPPQYPPMNDTLSNPTLRTDKILVPENKMRVYADILPDIYANNLRLKQFTTIAALRASAESLGLTFGKLSSPDTESQFYRGPLLRDAAQIVINTEKFAHVVPHLQPTVAQIRHRHHPYLDVLPFPTLRERIIEACSLDAPILDEEDLCDDLQKDGLICWGSYLGDGNLATGSGAPWDYRSWEAQPWFLKKWWFFIGGSQGELFQQTQWWHQMRGDRLVAPW